MIFKKVNDYIDNLKYEYIISETGLLFKRLYPNKQGSIRMTLDNGKRISVRKIINKCDKDLEIIRYDTDILLIINRIGYQLMNYGIDGGYYVFGFYGKDKSKLKIRIHRLMYKVFKGSIPEGYVVHHKDHNKLNNTPNNLILMRQDEHVSYHDTFRERDYHGRLV